MDDPADAGQWLYVTGCGNLHLTTTEIITPVYDQETGTITGMVGSDADFCSQPNCNLLPTLLGVTLRLEARHG